MQRLVLTSLALAAALAASGASAQSFSLTLGYQNTDPKSDNGQLAGADATVNEIAAGTTHQAVVAASSVVQHVSARSARQCVVAYR